ncbi:NAD(P)/FAD-dependent oxidoreductase [Candidatus Dependentiae bacterium]|nr:NAD(P)/FAD-dependent oxidoreductase [Candidatus Dependentiae bacterium]
MEKVDITIIGAGVVGLSISEKLSRSDKEIILLEKHDGFGREASSRNSEVIHTGIYYPKTSLKTQLCVEGNKLLYELCEEKAIPYNRVGKIIISNSEEESDQLQQLLQCGKDNGVNRLEIISSNEIKELEPHVKGVSGLYSPDSGILDSHSLMHYYEQESIRNGVTVAYNCEVIGIEKSMEGYIIEILDADGENFKILTEILINSSGLNSDKIASLLGIDIDSVGYRLHPCKGEYFNISNRHKGKVRHLIYPAPTKLSLGLHAVVELDGRLKLGPNAFYVNEINYDINLEHRIDFFKSAEKYFDFLEEDDLQPDQAGIRAKLQKPGEVFRDFIIKEESDLGFPGLINLIGIESPGLTAAPAIARFVFEMIIH